MGPLSHKREMQKTQLASCFFSIAAYCFHLVSQSKKPDKMMYSLASTMGLRTSAHFFHFELIEVSLVLFCHLPFRSLVSVCLGHSLVVHFHVTGLSSLDCKTVCNKTLSHRMCQIQTCHKYYDRLFYQTMARSQEAKQC